MKKFFIVVLAMLILTGCTSKASLDETPVVSYAVRFLNEEYGYDTASNYVLQAYTAQDETNPRYYVLLEDDREILSFIMKLSDDEEDMQTSDISSIHNGHYYCFYRYFNEREKEYYPKKANTLNVNDKLYLENVSRIEIAPYTPTDKDKYEKLEYWAEIMLMSEAKEGDAITIYEHLYVLYPEWDNENKTIIFNEKRYHYPVAVNGKISYLLSTDETMETAQMGGVDDNETWVRELKEGNSFLLVPDWKKADWIVIKGNEDIQINTPVIVKKSYQDLRAAASIQPAYQPILNFKYTEKD